VDREERPDIDHLYMAVCQMMTGGGGWPLSIIMTPEKKPFFAATYIPKENRFGRIGMLELTRRVKEIWETRRDEALSSAQQIATALRQISDHIPGEAPGQEILDVAYRQLLSRFDEEHGGFGLAPKFPTPHNLFFLLRYWHRTGRKKALEMVEKTLQNMSQGGIHDHVGFGFHRYSTDREWLVPHFEKMLYDQALLAMTYVEAHQATGKEGYGDTARQILAYVLRDMTAPEGAFHSAEDADSEGVEGKFYVWTLEDLQQALGEQEAELVGRVFSFEPGGNLPEEGTGEPTGANILHLKRPLSQIATDLGVSEADLRTRVEQAREKVFNWRDRRIHPHKDDKILADWNGLMIAAFAQAASVFERPEYAGAARRAADFVLDTMRTPDGRLLHRFRDGETAVMAMADDYAFFIWGLIELYETTFEVRYLRHALDLNRDFLTYFWDDSAGGFYLAPSDGENLLVRKKEIYDGAIPSANSVAAMNLLRLGRITANADLETRAHAIGRAFSGNVTQLPSAHTQFLTALQFGSAPSYEVVIVGDPASEDVRSMLRGLRKPFIPGKVVLFRPATEESPEIVKIAEYTRRQKSLDGKATAYVCLNYACELPTTDTEKMLDMLSAPKK
jgi:uncharacterized protein YyaL (SSP411 family)